ncbi:Ger(x)C family spore germination protein [Neobacillus massiliamazoniensis]|uniref:Spore germination protein GerKC n=1 Tax=Neobacillus massiliamazoniensis TaxID=1499688 RepID=A0A0U1NZ51_9BACI|nr:Ger(x)C family spore germination protein [Neobacillus massiliamazoniensis]CRK83267.1 spore germination protein GerKC [Neobacillus massiliamazoniensis]
MNQRHLFLFLPLFLLTGCWDQTPLQKEAMIMAASIDKVKKDSILSTVAIRGSEQMMGGQTRPINTIISETGHNLKETRLKVNKITVGEYSSNKLRVILLGEELAKDSIVPYIDSYLRDPKLTLSAKVAVVKGKASKIIKEKTYQHKLIGEALAKELETMEKNSVIPIENQQTIRNKISDEGKDLVLPYIEKKSDNTIGVTGVALFHGDRFTGATLKNYEPELLILLLGKKKEDSRMTVKYRNGENMKDFLSFNVHRFKRKMKINLRDGKPQVVLNTKMMIEINDYSGKSLQDKKELDKFNQNLSYIIEKDMNNVVYKLQNANCDALGIGRKLIAYHPDTWKKMKWNEEYPKIPITVHLEVKTINRGIIY